MMIFPVIVLVVVFLLIIVRKIGKFRLDIWHIMLAGAATVLLTGYISPIQALRSINLDVMLFLFGMFVVGQAMEDSGLLQTLAFRLFSRARTAKALLALIISFTAILSAVLMNDTIAIIGTPVMLMLARQNRISHVKLLLALAFSVTIGSVLSPIGNPQNLLIAIHSGIPNPFLTFLRYLLLPTILNLAVLYFFLAYGMKNSRVRCETPKVIHPKLYKVTALSLALIMLLIALKVALVFLAIDLRLTYIALAGAAPILIYRVIGRNFHITRRIDWKTLVFFAAMFVLMESVWLSGFFQGLMQGHDITGKPAIFSIGILMSQFISNVPLVALYLPMLGSVPDRILVSLAAASTIAGNIFILGAASNVIILQKAEKEKKTFSAWEFSKIGIPLTLISAAIYYLLL
jgi:Na+/H+ antiporter NhaD/arsenite permease-like protein